MSNGSDNIPHKDLEDQRANGESKRPSDFVDDLSGWHKARRFGRKTIKGDNSFGRVAGLGLDLLTLWAPAGGAIDAVRSRAKDALNITQTQNEMKDILKRAFTSDGGGLLRVRDADGKISLVAIGATVIRLALIVGVFKLAEVVGVAPEGILSFIGL